MTMRNPAPSNLTPRRPAPTPPTVQQQINGVAADLEALPLRPSADELQACINRLAAIRDRILRGA